MVLSLSLSLKIITIYHSLRVFAPRELLSFLMKQALSFISYGKTIILFVCLSFPILNLLTLINNNLSR